MPRLRTAGGTRGAAARQASLREHNVSLVLAEVLAAPTAISRAEVAARLGLARPTVSDLVDRLLAAGMLAELAPVPAKHAGRPAVPLVGSSTGFVAYGLEVNVNHLAICAMTLAGEVLAEEAVNQSFRGAAPTEVMAAVADLAGPVVASTRAGRRVVGVCVSVPGLIRQGTGTVQLAPNLGWQATDVAAALTALPTFADWSVVVANDADLGARAQLALDGAHADDPTGSFVFLSGEVGLGGAVIIAGQPYAGQHGWAGEIGHLCVDPDGPPCSCGANGCLEQYVGTEALLRSAGIADRRSVEGADQVQQLLDALADRDPRAERAVADAGRVLGLALAGVINIVDVDTIVLGGPLGRLHDHLAEPLGRELERRVITARWRRLSVRPSSSGQLGAARGGALTVLDRLVADPTAWFRP